MTSPTANQGPLDNSFPPGQLNQAAGLLARYDYVVVGGGSAGCVVARRLIDQTNATVLVLEAGGADTAAASIANPAQWFQNIDSPLDYRYVNEPSPHTNNRPIGAPRGKVLGGSGSINALVWSRGQRADYDGWAAVGNPGWEYDAVLPRFQQIEDWEGGATDFHGAGGPIGVATARNLHRVSAAFIEAGQSYGMPYLADTNGPAPLGVGPMSTNTRNGRRSSPFDGYLRPVLGHPNLTVLTGAQVVKLALEGTRCVGLQFVHEHRRRTVAASEVVLAAGAFDTPRLLLLSGIGAPAELARLGIPRLVDLPGVGQNLQDHPLVMGLCFEAHEPLGAPNENLIASTFYWKSQPGRPTADLMAFPFQVPVVFPPLAATHPAPENGFNLAPALVGPQSRGYVKMKTARYDGPLEIQPNFLADPADLEALTNAVEICMEVAQQPALQRLIKRWVTPTHALRHRPAVQEFLRNTCISYWHPVGTCAMGPGPTAVVSSTLQVHGVEGLRVVDASVMPRITAGNTQAPTLMIAEAAAALMIAGK